VAVSDRLGVREGAELRHGRLPDDDRSGFAEAADHLGVRRGRGAVPAAAERGHAAGDVELLLDRHRYAVQRSAGVALTDSEEPRLLASLVREDHGERVELGVVRLDGGQRPGHLGPR
jgi:hypothetical protein